MEHEKYRYHSHLVTRSQVIIPLFSTLSLTNEHTTLGSTGLLRRQISKFCQNVHFCVRQIYLFVTVNWNTLYFDIYSKNLNYQHNEIWMKYWLPMILLCRNIIWIFIFDQNNYSLFLYLEKNAKLDKCIGNRFRNDQFYDFRGVGVH